MSTSWWEWFGFDIRPFAAIVLVAILFLLGRMVIFSSEPVTMGERQWVDNCSAAEFHIADSSARFVWEGFGIAQSVTFIIVLWGYFATIYQPPVAWGQPQRKGAHARLAIAGVVTVVAFLAGFFLSLKSDDLPPNKYTVPGYLLAIARQECQMSNLLARFIDVSNGLAASVIFVAPLAVGALMINPPCPEGRWEVQAQVFEAQIRRLRYLLVMTATMLIVAVAQIYSEFRWATVTQTGSAGDVVPSSMAVAAGTAFSTGLLAIFLPAAAVLNERTDDFAKLQHPYSHYSSAQVERWKKDRGIAFGIGSLYLGSVAILGPLLAGLFTLLGFLK